MFLRLAAGLGACAALLVLFSFGCDSSTLGSNEGDACNPAQPNACGTGLECYVPPNCASAVCCPAQDPSNPVCYCPANTDAGADDADASATDGPATD